MTYRQLLASNADFRRLWLGQVISEIGDWLNNIAVLALAIQLAAGRSVGLAIAVYAVARHLPLFLFGPVAGVVVDRLDRRRVMIAADIVRAFLALGFLAADRLASLPVIYAVGASLFSVSAFFNAAKRASIPNLVSGTEGLLSANSLSASTTAATIAVGSALGGVVATALGRDTVFFLNALTFLASAEMIRRIRKPVSRKQKAVSSEQEAASSERRTEGGGREISDLKSQVSNSESGIPTPETSSSNLSARDDSTAFNRLLAAFSLLPSILRRAAWEFREGLRYVGRDALLRAVFVVAAGWGLGNGAARALYSIFGARLGKDAVSGWGEGARAFVERPTDFGISVLFVAMGVGGVLGAPLARRFNRAGGAGLGARMGRSLVLDGCGLALFSLMPSLWVAALVLVAREMNFAIWWTAQQTIMMKRTEDAFAGRVFATYETLTTLMMVASILVSGAAADRAGIRVVAAGGGSMVILSGLFWFLLRRRARAGD
ncbi:MAG: MFS transporter [Acidobacteria bacterium]|nr:MFS transporter [Acidobacteriota bacterium]